MRKTKTFDALLLLGLKLGRNGAPPAELEGRVRLAARCVLEEKLAPVIIACGGQTAGTPCAEAAVMDRLLRECGVPPEKIIREDRSLVTWENIRNARALLEKRAPEAFRGRKPRVVIVTSDYHLPRAKYIARSLGFRARGRAYATPNDREKRTRRKKERCYFVNYMLGWETGRHKRPGWYDRAARKLR